MLRTFAGVDVSYVNSGSETVFADVSDVTLVAPLPAVGQAVPAAIGGAGAVAVVTLERHRRLEASTQMRSRRTAVAESVTV
jgi:hypothetical protein